MRHSAAPLFSGGLVNEGGGRVQGGRATGPARLSLPRAGGPRGSRASRRLVPQGRAALLTRGSTGPYQRPPPTPTTLRTNEESPRIRPCCDDRQNPPNRKRDVPLLELTPTRP